MTHFRMDIKGQTLIGKDYGCLNPAFWGLYFYGYKLKLREVVII